MYEYMIITLMGTFKQHQGIGSWVTKGGRYELLVSPSMITQPFDNLNPQSRMHNIVQLT